MSQRAGPRGHDNDIIVVPAVSWRVAGGGARSSQYHTVELTISHAFLQRITTKSIHIRLVVVFMVFRSSLFRARSSSACVTSSMFSNGHLFPVSGCDPMSSVVLPRPHFPAPQKYLSLLLSPPPSLTPDACEQMCFVTFDELLVLPSSLCQPC